MSEVIIFESDAWVEGVTAKIVSGLRAALATRQRATLLLSGGSTPIPVHRALAQAKRIDWQQVHFFWGDERYVPADDPASNFRMARETLLDPLGIAPDAPNVHPFPTESTPQEDAAKYEQQLQDFFGLAAGEMPRFDVILLGMGGDGHTASLFPGTQALTESTRLAVANPVPAQNTTRLTLTYPVLNHAHHLFVLLKGEGKAARLAEVLTGEPNKYPIQGIQPTDGELLWLLDSAAASQLPNK
ncbi:MAG: 6-phosphogluconolactonase [Ardenticatenaceae bacterium]